MESYLPVILIDVVFLLIVLIINKHNAKYLLAGYNTMTTEEQKRFDIDGYLIFFKKFFIILTITSSILFVLLTNFSSQKSSLISYSVFISIMILWISLRGNSYNKN